MGMKADTPYPTMDEIGEDCRALRVVSPAYAGREGELTAVLQYVYQSVVLSECKMTEAAKELIEIAVTEMHHLEILATLICKLGAPPVYTACPPYPVGYYSSSCVNYVRAPKLMISADICAERQAIAAYSSMLCKLNNPCVAAVIERIIEDEKVHLQAFERMLREMEQCC